MNYMFLNCFNLTNLDINHFDVTSVTNGTSFLQNANNALTTTQYDELLEAWAVQDVQPNVAWHFGNAQYTVETVADWYSPRNASSLSIINNKLVSIADSTAVFGAAQQVDNLIVGNVYRFVGTATCSNSSAQVYIRVSLVSDLFSLIIFETSALGNVTANDTFIATATTMYFGVVVSGHAANDTVTIDAGITVKEVTNYTEANAASEIEYSQENVFGAEEVVNGDFATDSDWTKDVSWTISGGKANHGVSGGNSFLTATIQPDIVVGKTYNIIYEISNYTGIGTCGVSTGAFNNVTVSSNGSFTFTEVAIGTNFRILGRDTNSFSIDNVSVKEIVEVADFIEPVTQGMTLTEAWTTRGTSYLTLSEATSASVRVDATISNTDDGVLMEAGGSGQGVILYVYSGVLYFQCGKGTAYGTASNRAEVSYTLPTGEFGYIIEWSADTSNAVLYVNGLVVDSQAFSEVLLAGSNVGTLGEVEGLVPVNRGGWTTDGAGVYTNTITKCDIFNNQITSDV